MIESILSKTSVVLYTHPEWCHLSNRSLTVTCRACWQLTIPVVFIIDTSVYILLWPNCRENKYLMIYFILVLNRRYKSGFLVGEEKITADWFWYMNLCKFSASGFYMIPALILVKAIGLCWDGLFFSEMGTLYVSAHYLQLINHLTAPKFI